MAMRGVNGLGVGAVSLNPGSAGGKPAGTKRFSKRRERSAAHLTGAMSRVNEQLSVAEQINGLPLAVGPNANDAQGSPASSRRKNVSLWLPRVGSPAVDEDISSTDAHSACGSQEQATSTMGSPGWTSDGANAAAGDAAAADATPPGIGRHPGKAAEELEDLRLQNAILRKSLAMLQQSVVDSMKGNKNQFMGNGIFRPRKSMAGIDGGSGPGRPDSVQQDAASLEGLHAAFTERRNALKIALAERDEAVRDAQSARREAKALQQQNEELTQELQDCRAQAEHADAVRKAAEANCASAAERAAELEAQVEALRAEAEATLRQSLAVAEEEAAALRAQLEAARGGCAAAEADRASAAAECIEQAARIKVLQEDMSQLRQSYAVDQERLTRLLQERRNFAQRILATAFGDGCPLQMVFRSWAACLASAREVRLAEMAERIRQLEAETARLASEADAARAESDAIRADAAGKAREASESQKLAREAEEALRTAKAAAAEWERRAKESEGKVKALAAQLSQLKDLEKSRSGAADSVPAKELRDAEERIRKLQEDLDSASKAAADAAAQRDASAREATEAAEVAASQSREAAAREAALRKELEAAVRAATSAREAETSAAQKRDAARKQVDELEARAKKTLQDLQNVQRQAEESEHRAQESQNKVGYLQQRISALETKAIAEQARMEEASGLSEQNSRLEKELLMLKASLEGARGSSQQNTALAGEVSELKMALAEARCDAKSATEKLRLLRDEHAQVTRALEGERSNRSEMEQKRGELDKSAARFAADARQALQEAKQNIRIMVTAPKVSINVGGNSTDVHAPFPFAAIKESVQNEVVPKFSRVCAVGEEVGDAEVRKDVQSMVEQLALTLQTKVHELMPQAEGTCNWDGFGAKCGKLENKR